jgi:hypothetical protein
MNLGFFIMGGLIFAVYIYFTIWNIFYGARKQREENYPGYYDRHGQMGGARPDGMGNYNKFPDSKIPTPKRPKKKSSRTKTKTKTTV